MAEFEKWYNGQYPLPPTIERGPVGRDAKEQARSAWKAAISIENKSLRTQLAAAEKEIERKDSQIEYWQNVCKEHGVEIIDKSPKPEAEQAIAEEPK